MPSEPAEVIEEQDTRPIQSVKLLCGHYTEANFLSGFRGGRCAICDTEFVLEAYRPPTTYRVHLA